VLSALSANGASASVEHGLEQKKNDQRPAGVAKENGERTGWVMSNIVSGRQLRAARILAGLTQKQLARAVGVHERAARYWELKEDRSPTSTHSHLEKIETALRDCGVIVFAQPTPGMRLASGVAGERQFHIKAETGGRINE
jgi:DNA-binding XRE family transcriptional regulator